MAGAIVKGANFEDEGSTGFTASQLYSTASYADGDLTGIQLPGFNLTGWSFTNENLTNANFGPYVSATTLTNANFTSANLTNADLGEATLTGANFSAANLARANLSTTVLTGANFSDADLRGATGWSPVASTITQNTIQPNGSIQGLALGPNETLVIRNNAIPVTVQTTATFDPASTLQFQLDQNWTSPLGFAPGVTPAFNGTLDLEFASDVAPGNLLGTTFQIFNYNAPLAANNQFARTTSAGGTFNLSNLYTTGAATLIGVPAVIVGTPTTPATMQLPSGVGLMTTSSLTINPSSTLDITNNALAIINYAPGNSPAAMIRQWLTTGYANDTWLGPGIDSSIAASNPGRYAIGYADGNTDQGTAAAANQVLIEYTLAGDANLDGTVNFADLLVVAQNFNHTLDTHGNPIDWADGDFNYDGKVNFADLLLVAQNFNQTLTAGQLAQLPSSFSAAWNLALADVQQANTNNVPEPASAALLALAAAGLLPRRRRR